MLKSTFVGPNDRDPEINTLLKAYRLTSLLAMVLRHMYVRIAHKIEYIMIVDEVYLAYSIATITVVAPLLVYLILTSPLSAKPEDLIRSQSLLEDKGNGVSERTLAVQNQSNEFSLINQDNKNPEEVLRIAYEEHAQSEVNRCLGQSNYKDLCNDVMQLLIESCADKTMYVTACDDPRLQTIRN